MVEVSVREAVRDDVDFLREGLRSLNEEMRELEATVGIQGSNGLDIEGCLRRDAFLIAAQGKERRGFLSIHFPYPPPEKALVPPRHHAMINTVFVLPAFRRQGIASRLLGNAEAKCRAWSATGIYLGFIEGNDAAEAAYKKAGYVATRRVMLRSLD